MKRNFFTLLVAALLFAANASAQSQDTDAQPTVYEYDYIVKVGDVAPDFTLQLTDGSEFTLSEHRGKVVMLQFTAGWCGVCRQEMPHIESEIWQVYKDNKDFVLVGVDREETKEEIADFTAAVGATYPIAMDEFADVFSLYALPQSGITRNVLIDRDGKIVMLTRLFKEDEFAALVKKIGEMLE